MRVIGLNGLLVNFVTHQLLAPQNLSYIPKVNLYFLLGSCVLVLAFVSKLNFYLKVERVLVHVHVIDHTTVGI